MQITHFVSVCVCQSASWCVSVPVCDSCGHSCILAGFVAVVVILFWLHCEVGAVVVVGIVAPVGWL